MINVRVESFPLARIFMLSRGSKARADVLMVEVAREGLKGRGECVPYARYGETLESVRAQIASLPPDIEREDLQAVLPPGAARNVVDCALWDLEARRSKCRVWDLTGHSTPGPVVTAFTLSLDKPETMYAQAMENAHRPLLKIKLGATGDMERLRAVRAGAPKARLILDANEGWTTQSYMQLVPELSALEVELIEQPFPAHADDALKELPRPVAICADESCHDRSSLSALQGKYDVVNIKLDKTGGLTEALATCAKARELGFGLMVGCMVGSSLAMAPAMILAQGAQFVDLDGALLLAKDRDHALHYDHEAGLHPPKAALWG